MPQSAAEEILDMLRRSLSAGHEIKIFPIRRAGEIAVTVRTGFTTVASARPTLEEALRASIESAIRPITNAFPT